MNAGVQTINERNIMTLLKASFLKFVPITAMVASSVAVSPAASWAAASSSAQVNASITASTSTSVSSTNTSSSNSNMVKLGTLIGQGEKASPSDQSQCGQLCQAIKQVGGQEISRRLTVLNNLLTKINDATHLSASDKSYLTTEVNGEISGLTQLQTKLANDTTLNAAVTDAKGIITDYRVYVLVAPKVMLVKTADDQQTTESNLSTLAAKLQYRISKFSKKGKDVSQLQQELNDMNVQIKNAQTISVNIEQSVLPLQPANYNSNHNVLIGDLNQLKTAHADNKNAVSDAKNIIAGIKSLK